MKSLTKYERCTVFSLGAQHDKKSYGCPASDQYIMTSFSMELDEEKYKNAFTFSWCSVQMMKMCFLGRPYGGVSPLVPYCTVLYRVTICMVDCAHPKKVEHMRRLCCSPTGIWVPH